LSSVVSKYMGLFDRYLPTCCLENCSNKTAGGPYLCDSCQSKRGFCKNWGEPQSKTHRHACNQNPDRRGGLSALENRNTCGWCLEDYSDLSDSELTQTLYEMYYSKRPEDDSPDRSMIRDITDVTGLEYNTIVDKLATKMQNSVENMAPADLSKECAKFWCSREQIVGCKRCKLWVCEKHFGRDWVRGRSDIRCPICAGAVVTKDPTRISVINRDLKNCSTCGSNYIKSGIIERSLKGFVAKKVLQQLGGSKGFSTAFGFVIASSSGKCPNCN
jgi:hypothetical protein